jgi:hypothetical protein
MNDGFSKIVTPAVFWLGIAIAPATADDSPNNFDGRWNLTAASEVRYFSWRSDRGYPAGIAGNSRGKGSEIYVPFALALTGLPTDDLKVELIGRGGWVRASQSTKGLSGELSTATDTVAGATFTYLGWKGIQPFISVNFNFPTGQSALFGTDANVRMDPDLVEITSFGEGLNVGPTVGINLPINDAMILALSAGYTNRGHFTREKSLTPTNPMAQTPTDINPGDTYTFVAALGYQIGQLTGKLTGSIAGETNTTVDGLAVFRPGIRFLLASTWSYSWPETWGITTLDTSVAHSRRNNVRFYDQATTTPLGFDLEPFNSNANLYRVGLEHLFPVGNFWIGPMASFLYRDHNSYNSATLQFVPAKERWSAGGQAKVSATEKLSFSARVEYVWTDIKPQSPADATSLLIIPNAIIPGSGGVPGISSHGWQISGGLNWTL